ncbi:uncharacterized protein [Henckelia pumila]|uniref:uncharacterized protein n=1 Tax=Henckelia pumila TaxID=405737 RepID=UPI003C6E78C9
MDVTFVWSAECEHSFDELRGRLTSIPVISLPSSFGDYVVYTDASLQGLYFHNRAVSSVVHEWCSLGFTFRHKGDHKGIRAFSVLADPTLFARIREIHLSDPKTQRLARHAQRHNTFGFHFQSDGLSFSSRRAVVPDDSSLHEKILSQAHHSRFNVHPDSAKMYKDLCTRFLWKGMKHNVYNFLSHFLVCQQI